jgi:hypothetical protein
MEMSGHLHTLATLPPGKEMPGTHFIGAWMGTRTGLEATEESNLSSSAVLPVTCHYTKLAILAQYQMCGTQSTHEDNRCVYHVDWGD